MMNMTYLKSLRLSLLVLVAGVVLPSFAQKNPPIYALREAYASTGSNIRVQATPKYIVPINRRYEELTSEDKIKLRRIFPNLHVNEEPPFPADGMMKLFEVIRKTREHIKHTGDFHMSVLVDEKGNAELVHIYSSPSNEMTEIMTQALVLIKYKPAVCEGQSCKMEFPLKLNFTQALAY
jgi:hypothetical protein